MKKISVVAFVLLTAVLSFGQTPRVVSFHERTSDVFVGFSTTSPDYGKTWSSYELYGGEVAYTHSLTGHLSLVGAGLFSFGNAFDVKQVSLTAGPRVNFLTGKIRPYGTGQIGYSYQSSTGMYALDHNPPLKLGANETESGLTYRLGVGVDVQLTNRFYLRAGQIDIQPQPWGRHTPDYINFTTGIGYTFGR